MLLFHRFSDLPVLEMLKSLNPSSIEVEFRLASPIGGGSVQVMEDLLGFIDHGLASGRDYELMQAYLGLFLKVSSNYHFFPLTNR